ncbi:inositol hexakisphosphate kinase 1-like isoform X3 [Xenia sp. Carnegie-2017]|uniref:inositol hexakisphosphate kinase 1-like isoform X3 n=1 Tax=Xenia sp. Carnegie-2017 TaxID=2897299 RepID=UPI001F03CD23|nr:inositol hexakisphosphate kinase 1-like isoform X3 [Xenia sp. Carnegie-2017]
MEDLQFGREKNREYSTIVSLEPFAHQVGGHSTLQLLDKFTVCKPLFTKELRFYQDANPLFKPFLPEFKGVARVRNVYGKDSGEGLWEMVNSNEDVNRHCYRYGKHCTSCTCIGNSERTGKRISNKGVDNRISENFYRAAVSKDKDKNEDDSSLEYLLLENVVGRYKYPCILDLKMGTEKHRDYVISQEEQSLRQARWDKTTSKSLGVRLCGMKQYTVL